MQVFAGNYFNTKLRIRFLGIILMFLEYARLRLWRSFVFQREIPKFCLALSFIPYFFRAWTDRNCPKENLDFWLMIFPQNEKLFIRYMLSAQQILILLILYAKPYFPLRCSSCSGAVLLSSLRSYVTGRQETAALVPGFLCQSGRRRRFNVSFLSSLIFWRLMTNTIETL